MPNWCENQLSITGKKDELTKLLNIADVNGEYKLLETLYPMPEELNISSTFGEADDQLKKLHEVNKEKYGHTDWYSWRNANWGCKWPESDLRIAQELSDNNDGTWTIALDFETPWGPPIEAFEKIASDYPSLLFCLYYEEPGMGFCGNNIWAKGECVDSSQSEIVNRHFDEQYLYDLYMEKEEN